MNHSTDVAPCSPESQSPSNPYAPPSLIEEPARAGVDFADAHLLRWLRIREFFVIHLIATAFILAFFLISQFVDSKPATRPWYMTAVAFPAFFGFPCMLMAPGRALFLAIFGFTRDRRLFWFAFGHIILVAIQGAAYYFAK